MESNFEKRVERQIERGVKRGFHKFFHGLFCLILGTAIFAVLGLVVMWLWNWLLPSIFGITAISFWQALGILALSKILFGGFGKHHFKHKHRHHNRIRERWLKMSDEEREEFLKHRHHFGCKKKYSKTGETENQD